MLFIKTTKAFQQKFIRDTLLSQKVWSTQNNVVSLQPILMVKVYGWLLLLSNAQNKKRLAVIARLYFLLNKRRIEIFDFYIVFISANSSGVCVCMS